jgi:soluble lytic murein transglycosylase
LRVPGVGNRTGKRRIYALLPVLFVLATLLTLLLGGVFWDLLAPLTHKTTLYRLGGVYKVDPLMLAAIVACESRFDPFAESRQGALGLMQLMPATAEEMANELRLDYKNSEDLYHDELNLELGTYYFVKLRKAYKGDVLLALAAYNAGAAKVRLWNLPALGAVETDRIDAIPVNETRAYVQGVLENYRWLKRLQRIKRFLRGDS